MDWILAHAQELGALFGVLGGAWAFLGKLERTYRRHLKTDLVSKREFAELKEQTDRVESKIDQLVELAFYRSTRRQNRASRRRADQAEG